MRIWIAAALLAAAPASAQSAADTTAVRAAALRTAPPWRALPPIPPSDTARRAISWLGIRGDTAKVIVGFPARPGHVHGYTLTLARREDGWTVLPVVELFAGTIEPGPTPQPQKPARP